MQNDCGDIVSGNDAILEEVKFQSDLYTTSTNYHDYGENENNLKKNGITQDDIPKLSNEEATLCEGVSSQWLMNV